MSNITHELITNDWFDETAIRLPNYRVGRVNFQAGRSYIKLLEDGTLAQPFRLYTSLTTAINASLPTPDTLMDWKFKHGKKESQRLTTLAQHYGTMMHLEIAKYCIEKVYNLDGVDAVIENYTSEHNYWEPECGYEWPTKLKQDMLAFIQFSFDYEIVTQGIEVVLLSERGFGTMIDWVGLITVDEKGEWGEVYKSGARKGEPKITTQRVQKRACINFKSGRKGFYESHEIQIECERQLWEENFPDMPIDIAANWAPADWISVPGYKFKAWEGGARAEEVTAILSLAEVRYRGKAEKRQYMNMSGVIATPEALAQAIQYEDVEEYCNRKFGNTPAPVKKRTTRTKKVEKDTVDVKKATPAPKSTPLPVPPPVAHFVSKPLPI